MRLKLLILLSVLVFLTACTQKEEKQKGSQDKAVSESGSIEARGSEGMENDPQGTDTGNTPGEPASVLSLTKSGPSDSGENKTDKSEASADRKQDELLWSPFSGPLYLQSLKPVTYILPESLMIGPLSDPLSYTLAERKAHALVVSFWNSYRTGRIPRELLSKSAHPLFMEEMNQYLEKGREVIDFYPGSFSLSGQSASMKLVLLSETGYLKGVMYMKNENDRWSLDDWEMPFRYWPGETVPRDKDLMQRRTVY